VNSPAKCFEFSLELIALAIPRPAAISKDESANVSCEKNEEI